MTSIVSTFVASTAAFSFEAFWAEVAIALTTVITFQGAFSTTACIVLINHTLGAVGDKGANPCLRVTRS